jgi:hypothetical protein
MAKTVFSSFLSTQQKSPHVFGHVARFFVLGEKLQGGGDAKWGELAGFFSVFTDFLSELGAKEIWVLKELEAQFLTCIQILRNMGILRDYTENEQREQVKKEKKEREEERKREKEGVLKIKQISRHTPPRKWLPYSPKQQTRM